MIERARAIAKSLLQATRGQGELEDQLMLLGVIAVGLFAGLALTLFLVQASLDRSQRQLAEIAIPAEERIAQLESAMGDVFRRQDQVATTHNLAELELSGVRARLDERLRAAGRATVMTPVLDGDSFRAIDDGIPSDVEKFLAADSAFFSAVARQQEQQASFDRELAEVDGELRQLVVEAEGIYGSLRFDYMVRLRALVNASANKPLRDAMVRGVTLDGARAVRYAASELVAAVTDFGWCVNRLASAPSLDAFNSIAANELPQARARVDRLLATMRWMSTSVPREKARIEALATRFTAHAPDINEGEDASLLSLRRQIFASAADAAARREESEVVAHLLEKDSSHQQADVAALTARALTAARISRTTTRMLSLLVALAGFLGCIFATRRIVQGIGALKSRNEALTGLKENLTALNATLDWRVAERTQELSAANKRLKQEMTHREQMESELRLAQKLESLGRMAAGVAHEINTPIQFVSDSIHYIRDAMGDLFPLLGKYQSLEAAAESGKVSPEMIAALSNDRESADLDYLLDQVPRSVERAMDGLDRVARIVRSMKEFAHPEQVEMAAIDLNRAIQSTLTIARSAYKNVADVELHLGEIPHVNCYGSEVNQVLLNLIVNAAHAIEEVVGQSGARGRIRVETSIDLDAVKIAIHDTGAGIPEEIHERIFDPFFTTKPVGQGTGQGLAIARSVIQDKHGGKLAFTSEKGRGTEFVIRLPIAGKRASSTQAA